MHPEVTVLRSEKLQKNAGGTRQSADVRFEGERVCIRSEQILSGTV